MTRPRKPRCITIIGRTWWNRAQGYTLGSVAIFIDGDQVHSTRIGTTDHDYSAAHWLQDRGYMPGRRPRDAWIGAETLAAYCYRKGIILTSASVPVGRKKDLRHWL